jgi:hypothetical protein
MSPEDFKKHFRIPRKGKPDPVSDLVGRNAFNQAVSNRARANGIHKNPKFEAIPVRRSTSAPSRTRKSRAQQRQESSRISPHALPVGDTNVNASADPALKKRNDLDSDVQQSPASHTNISSTLPNSNHASPAHTIIKVPPWSSSTVLRRSASDPTITMSDSTPRRDQESARESEQAQVQTPRGQAATSQGTSNEDLTPYVTPLAHIPGVTPGFAQGYATGMLSPGPVPSPYHLQRAYAPNPFMQYAPSLYNSYIPVPTYQRAKDILIGSQSFGQAMNSSNWRNTMGAHNAYTILSPPHHASGTSNGCRSSAAVSSGQSNNYYSRGGAVPTTSAFGFDGYLPSSLHDLESMGLRYAVDNQLIATEAARGKLNLQISNFADDI